MEKPRPWIAFRHTNMHDSMGVLYIGEFALPLVIPAGLYALALAISFVWGVVVCFIENPNDISPLIPFFILLGLLIAAFLATLVVALIAVGIMIIIDANRKEGY